MSSPPLVKESEPTMAVWMRNVRNAVNGIITRSQQSGPTSQRPANPAVGVQFFDTTLNKPIWYGTSSAWVDATGVAA